MELRESPKSIKPGRKPAVVDLVDRLNAVKKCTKGKNCWDFKQGSREGRSASKEAYVYLFRCTRPPPSINIAVCPSTIQGTRTE